MQEEEGGHSDIAEWKWVANCSNPKCEVVGQYLYEGDVFLPHNMKKHGKRQRRKCGSFNVDPRMTWAHSTAEEAQEEAPCCRLYDGLFVIFRVHPAKGKSSQHQVGRITDYEFGSHTCCLEEYLITAKGKVEVCDVYVAAKL